MDPKVNYFVVGVFVVILTAATILFSLWMIFGANQKTYRDYLIYMFEPVIGLNVEAPVKFNGVNVGSVTGIHLQPDNPEEVVVQVEVQTDTPISVDTKATMMSQGITGLAFINLKGGDAHSAPLKALPGQKIPVIQTSPSLFFRLDSTISDLSSALTQINRNLVQVLGQTNRDNLAKILGSLATISDNLAHHTDQMDASLNALPLLLKNASEASVSLNQSLNDMNGQLSQSVLPSLAGLTSELQNDPAMLIRGRSPQVLGPGE